MDPMGYLPDFCKNLDRTRAVTEAWRPPPYVMFLDVDRPLTSEKSELGATCLLCRPNGQRYFPWDFPNSHMFHCHVFSMAVAAQVAGRAPSATLAPAESGGRFWSTKPIRVAPSMVFWVNETCSTHTPTHLVFVYKTLSTNQKIWISQQKKTHIIHLSIFNLTSIHRTPRNSCP